MRKAFFLLSTLVTSGVDQALALWPMIPPQVSNLVTTTNPYGFTFDSSGSNTIPEAVTNAGITPADLGNALVTAYNAVINPDASTTLKTVSFDLGNTTGTAFAALVRCVIYNGGRPQTDDYIKNLCPQGVCPCGSGSLPACPPNYGFISMAQYVYSKARDVSPTGQFNFPKDSSVSGLETLASALGITTPTTTVNMSTPSTGGGADCLALLAQTMKSSLHTTDAPETGVTTTTTTAPSGKTTTGGTSTNTVSTNPFNMITTAMTAANASNASGGGTSATGGGTSANAVNTAPFNMITTAMTAANASNASGGGTSATGGGTSANAVNTATFNMITTGMNAANASGGGTSATGGTTASGGGTSTAGGTAASGGGSTGSTSSSTSNATAAVTPQLAHKRPRWKKHVHHEHHVNKPHPHAHNSGDHKSSALAKPASK